MSRVVRAGLDRRNFLSVVRARSVYVDPLRDFLGGYVMQRGSYPRFVETKTPIGRSRIELGNPLDAFTVNEVFCWEIYALGSSPSVIVDFGSNIGVSEAYFLTRNAANVVYGFEPVPRLFEQLTKNTAVFGDRAVNQAVAVDVNAGTAEMGIESSGRYGGLGLVKESQIIVPTLAANDVLREVLERCRRIDLLKIDIEGVEERVLNSIDQATLARVHLIYVEAGDDDRLMPDALREQFTLSSHRGICRYRNRNPS